MALVNLAMDRSRWLDGVGGKLWVSDLGPVDAEQTLLCLHGMRDHGESFRALEREFPSARVVLPDLRGHGQSDWTASYTLTEFAADLAAVLDQLEVSSIDLIGHSLGGHIATRYAAAFADRVRRLVVIDGFGPPRSQHANSPIHLAEGARREIEQRRLAPPSPRVMRDVAEASMRLANNNPKLSQQEANRLAEYGVRSVRDGVVWRWDGHAQTIWSSFSHRDTELLLQAIKCPTLVVTGDDGLSYWLRMHPELEGQQALYEAELKRRCDLIPNGQHWVVEGAGHMVHYDAPEQLYCGINEFLAKSH